MGLLITSRNRSAALELVEEADIITVNPMDKEDAFTLLRKKLGQSIVGDGMEEAELATVLEYMPLAIAQAAARSPECR